MTEASADLVVVGAGGGLVAALRAAEAGLDVVVVEASEHFRRGNNTSMSTAMIPGAGSRFQRAAGVVDSAECFVEDMTRKTKGQVDIVTGAALARVSAQLVEWLADSIGLPMELVTDFSYPGHSVHRLHTVPGRHGSRLVDDLVHKVSRHDKIDLLVPARLVGLLTDANGVCGALVERPDGSREELFSRHVLLATNGFGADRQLVAEHLPGIAHAAYHGSEFSRGDALRLGSSVGAHSAFLDAYQGHAALATRGATLVGWATVMHGGVMVDLTGRRFGDETCGYSEYAPMLASRPEGVGWIIFDSRIHDACRSFTDYGQTVASGAVIEADDVSALAAVTGLPCDALSDEIDQVMRSAREGIPDRFGRVCFEQQLCPPFCAVKVQPALFHTQGGLVVDADARVLRPDRTPINGLYAAGGAAMGISGHGAAGYLAGNGLLPALGFSFLAAEHAAAHHRSNTGEHSPHQEASCSTN